MVSLIKASVFLLIQFCVARYYTGTVGSAWFQYLSSVKYTYMYKGPFPIAFNSICNSTELPVFFFL